MSSDTAHFWNDREERRYVAESDWEAETSSSVTRVRFGINGEAVGWNYVIEDSSTALNRDPLRTDDGSVADRDAYTIGEAMELIVSAVHGQRLIGIQLIHRVIQRSRPSFLAGDFPSRDETLEITGEKDVSWGDVWSFLLYELDVVKILRQLMHDRSKSVVYQALAATAVVTCRTYNEMAIEDLMWRHPLTAFPPLVSLPIQRELSSLPWSVADEQGRTLLLYLERHIKTGMLKDLSRSPFKETSPLVTSILAHLARNTPSSVKEIICEVDVIRHLAADLIENQSTVRQKCVFLDLLCQTLIALPAGDHTWVIGCSEAVLPDVGRWRRMEYDAEEMPLIRMFFRLCRLCLLRECPFLSSDDLFAIYYPLFPPASFFWEEIDIVKTDLVQEIYLYLSTAAKSSQSMAMLQGSLAAVREVSLETLISNLGSIQSLVSPKIDPRLSCLASMLLFLAYDWSSSSAASWTETERASLTRIVKTIGTLEFTRTTNLTSIERIEMMSFLTCCSSLFRCTDEDCFLEKLVSRADFLQPIFDGERTKGAEVGDILHLRSLCHFANFAAAVIQSAQKRHLLDDGRRTWTVGYSLGAVSWFPPGYDTIAIDCLCMTLSSQSLHTVVTEVKAILRRSPRLSNFVSGDSEWLGTVTGESLETVLLHGVLATWFDTIPESQLSPETIDRLRYQPDTATHVPFYTSVDLHPCPTASGSRLPLPVDYIYRPLKTTPVENNTIELESPTDLELLRCQLFLLVYTESTPSFLPSIGASLKMKRLGELVLLNEVQSETKMDSWDDTFVCSAFSHLVSEYVDAIPREKIPFEGWNVEFVETLLSLLVSSGEPLIGAVVAVLLLDCAPIKLKVLVWKTLSEQMLLHLLPPFSFWFGKEHDYMSQPLPPSFREMIENALHGRALLKAMKINSGIVYWVEHQQI